MTADSEELSPDAYTVLHEQALAGEIGAQFLLAEALERGWGVERSTEAAVRWYLPLAANGDSEAAYRAGTLMLAHGEARAAVVWLRRAAEAGHADAQAALATCYQRGQGVAPDRRETVHWGERAASGGSAAGRYNLALCYREGYGVARNPARAVALLTLAASQGYARAQLVLGRHYATGDGVAADRETAVKWYAAGAAQGYAKARYNLALMLLAEGDPEADRRALAALRAAAEQGYAKAWYLLATNYRRGIGVPADRARAQEYLYLAAAAGLAKAQYRLAKQANRTTVTGERSYWKWLRRAAAGGHAKAQYRLGELIISAAPADRGTALGWLRRSADGADERAAYLLALCYAKGHGVAANRALAYRWMIIARGAGHNRAARQSEKLARSLSAEEIAGIDLEIMEAEEQRAVRKRRRRLRIE